MSFARSRSSRVSGFGDEGTNNQSRLSSVIGAAAHCGGAARRDNMMDRMVITNSKRANRALRSQLPYVY